MRSIRILMTVLALVVVTAAAGEAAEKVFIRDIQADPPKYLNIPVQIRGEVVQVTSEGQPTRGMYALRDESDRQIAVRSRDLPAPGRTVVVEGLLTQDAGTTVFYVRELSRCEPGLLNPFCGGLDWWLIAVIGAAVIVVVLVAVLVYVLMRPPAPAAATVPVSTPIATPLGEKTRAVSSEELRRTMPSSQPTVRLPTVPAQLEVLSGPKAGTKLVLKHETTVGRSNSDLALDDPTVSTEHAKIRFDNQVYHLLNRSLTNPTRVNGQAIEGGADLKDGDELIMGSVKLRFSLVK